MHREGQMHEGRSAIVARDALVAACAVSAGIHGALTPEHLREAPSAGVGFLVSTMLLAGLCVALTLRPTSRGTAAVAGAVLAGLLVAYGFAVATGVPVLHPETEHADALGLATKAVELVGLIAALHLTAPRQPAAHVARLQPKGTTR